MAQKKKVRKASWLTIVLIYTFFPLIIWSLAFVAWLYWDSITAPFSTDKAKDRNLSRTTGQLEKSEKGPAPAERVQEKILEDDRKKLEEVLKPFASSWANFRCANSQRTGFKPAPTTPVAFLRPLRSLRPFFFAVAAAPP